jgi:hypothetical protein
VAQVRALVRERVLKELLLTFRRTLWADVVAKRTASVA